MKIEDYNAIMDPEERRKLIENTKDIDFIRECIINKDLDFSIYERVRLLESTRDLLNIEDKEYMSITDLAITGGMEFCKACIKGFIFKGWQAYKLIEEMRFLVTFQNKESEKDYINFVKECIRDKELEINKERLIKELCDFATSDEEKEECVNFIKEYIKDEKSGLSQWSKPYLISKMESLIDLTDKENLKDYINFIKDEKIGLSNLNIGEIILEVKSLIGSDNKENLNICREALKSIVIHMKEKDAIEYLKEIKDFILPDDKEGHKDYEDFQKNFSELLKSQIKSEDIDVHKKMDKIKLLSFLINEKDKESVEDYKKCIEIFENSDLLFGDELIVLKILKGNKEDINQELGINLHQEEYMEIDLPEGMTIGIEIESEGDFGEELVGSKVFGWEAKEDGSIDGVEITSPILSSSTEDSKDIYQICEILKVMGQEATKKCGGHIHIGADFLRSKEAYANLLEIWGNSEAVLYKISNTVGEITRTEALETYAPPISKKIQNAIENGTLDLNSEDDLEEFQEQIKNVQDYYIKYSSINFGNVNSKMNTIEFRLSNGTLNPQTWIENVNLFGGIIKASQELADVSEKKPEELTEDDKNKLEIFEKIKSGKLDEKEILDCVLDLSVSKDKKHIYVERYKINNILIKNNRTEKRMLQKKIASKTINIKRKELGKVVLTGENAINGVEVQQTRTNIMQDLSRSSLEGEVME